MEETLKKLCIKVSRDADLKICLDKTLKSGLKIILDSYGVKLLSSAKKQDFSDKAFETVIGGAKDYLKADDNNAASLLKQLCEETNTYSSEDEISELKPLMDRGLVFFTAEGDSAVPVVPQEIRNMLEAEISLNTGESLEHALSRIHERPEEANAEASELRTGSRTAKVADMDRTEEQAEIIRYARALSNMYGMYTPAQLKEIWDINHRYGISPAEINNALKKSGDEDGFYILNNKYIVNPILENDNDCNELLSKLMIGDVYYYPQEDEVRLYEDGIPLENLQEYKYIRNYISRKLGSKDKLDEALSKLLKAALMDYAPSKLLSLLTEYDISFDDDIDNDRFITLYISWMYLLRVWVCKGYRPVDLRVEKMQNRNYRLPANIDPRRRKKIGRNDKCPCGSELKFKNCCGR